MSKIAIVIYLIIYVACILIRYLYMFKIWDFNKLVAVVWWLSQWASNQMIAGSNPGVGMTLLLFFFSSENETKSESLSD